MMMYQIRRKFGREVSTFKESGDWKQRLKDVRGKTREDLHQRN